MSLRTFLLKLNWRQVLLDLLACYFLMYAFQTFCYLYDIGIVEISRQYDQKSLGSELNKRKIDHDYYTDIISYYPFAAAFIGLLFGLVVSLIVSFKRCWFWLNCFIAFVSTYCLFRLNLPPWKIVAPSFRLPGQPITRSVRLEFIINGIITLGIGLFILLSTYSKRFIERRYSAVNY